jgi:hypothetical protein
MNFLAKFCIVLALGCLVYGFFDSERRCSSHRAFVFAFTDKCVEYSSGFNHLLILKAR